MSEQAAPAPKTSRARKIVSSVLLVALLVVLAIEVRSAVGYTWSGASMQNGSEEGVLLDTSHEDLKSLLKFWPKETIVSETEGQTRYKYTWFSLLRPLMSDQENAYYVILQKVDDAHGAVYDVVMPNDAEVSRIFQGMNSTGAPPVSSGLPSVDEISLQTDSFGAGRRDSGGTREDPMLKTLDSDSDGEISEEELVAAADALLKLDTDGDGNLTSEELGVGGGNGGGGGNNRARRPPMEDDED